MKKVSGYFSVDLGAGSDVGSVREQNEDAFHTLLGTGSDNEPFDAPGRHLDRTWTAPKQNTLTVWEDTLQERLQVKWLLLIYQNI